MILSICDLQDFNFYDFVARLIVQTLKKQVEASDNFCE